MMQNNNFEPSENFSETSKSKRLLQRAKIKSDDPRLRGIIKERLVVSQMRRYLNEYPMVIVAGPRKVGKTTALLQMAVENETALYFDCRDEGVLELLSDITLENSDMLLLLDEFHCIPRVGDWMHMFNTYGSQNKNFRVVLTGSVSAFATLMAQIKGGGRNRLLHIPLLTYLEYLHFTKGVPYDADLTQVTSEESFKNYMILKDLHGFDVPRIDLEYVEDAAREVAVASKICLYATGLLSSSSEDVKNALMILAYKLIDVYQYEDSFKDLPVGNRELDSASAYNLRIQGAFGGLSVWDAVCAQMNDTQVAEAIKYLLWNELALCNYVITEIEDRVSSDILLDMYLGKPVNSHELKQLFSKTAQISVTNPLFYSFIADDLWALLERYVTNKDASAGIVRKIKARLDSCESFLNDNHLVGSWVETYLKGTYALLGKAPFKTKSFVGDFEKEIDIADSFHGVMIEVAVRNTEKRAKDVNFHLAYTGREKCFLTTKQTLEKVCWNDVPIWRIPYHMLAAFLDRGEIPSESVLQAQL